MMNAITQETGDAGPTPGGAAGPEAGNTNNGANQHLALQQREGARVLYRGSFYTGNLPAPTGEVAQYINRSGVSTVELRAQSEECFDFLNSHQ